MGSDDDLMGIIELPLSDPSLKLPFHGAAMPLKDMHGAAAQGTLTFELSQLPEPEPAASPTASSVPVPLPMTPTGLGLRGADA